MEANVYVIPPIDVTTSEIAKSSFCGCLVEFRWQETLLWGQHTATQHRITYVILGNKGLPLNSFASRVLTPYSRDISSRVWSRTLLLYFRWQSWCRGIRAKRHAPSPNSSRKSRGRSNQRISSFPMPKIHAANSRSRLRYQTSVDGAVMGWRSIRASHSPCGRGTGISFESKSSVKSKARPRATRAVILVPNVYCNGPYISTPRKYTLFCRVAPIVSRRLAAQNEDKVTVFNQETKYLASILPDTFGMPLSQHNLCRRKMGLAARGEMLSRLSRVETNVDQLRWRQMRIPAVVHVTIHSIGFFFSRSSQDLDFPCKFLSSNFAVLSFASSRRVLFTQLNTMPRISNLRRVEWQSTRANEWSSAAKEQVEVHVRERACELVSEWDSA